MKPNLDYGSAIITLENGNQVHASITIEETENGWTMSVTGTPHAGAVSCETLWQRHGSKGDYRQRVSEISGNIGDVTEKERRDT